MDGVRVHGWNAAAAFRALRRRRATVPGLAVLAMGSVR